MPLEILPTHSVSAVAKVVLAAEGGAVERGIWRRVVGAGGEGGSGGRGVECDCVSTKEKRTGETCADRTSTQADRSPAVTESDLWDVCILEKILPQKWWVSTEKNITVGRSDASTTSDCVHVRLFVCHSRVLAVNREQTEDISGRTSGVMSSFSSAVSGFLTDLTGATT